MRRRRALGAEVLARLDQPAAEDLLPEPVDGDARDERIVRSTSQRARPSRLIAQIVAHGRQRPRRAGVDALALRREAAAHAQLVRGPLEGRALPHDQRRRDLQVGQRLPRGGERVARRLRAAGVVGAEHAPRARRPALDVRSAAGMRSTGRSRAGSPRPERIVARRSTAEAEASDALPDRAVELIDPDRAAACRRCEAERRRGGQHGVARQRVGVAHRVDRPEPLLRA